MAVKKKAPWKRGNPKKKSKPLTPTQKKSAKRKAKRAGRPYPNLVDNMNAAKESSRKKSTKKKKSTRKTATKKRAPKKAAKKRAKKK